MIESAVGDVRRVLGAVVGREVVDSLGDGEPFFDRGIVDSLHLVEIIDHIQGDLGIDVAGEDLSPENFGSISAMARFLERQRQADP